MEEWGLKIEENPASIRRPKGEEARDRRLDKETEEEARLFAALAYDPILTDAAVIAIDTAMQAKGREQGE
jgi:hypothetical protein